MTVHNPVKCSAFSNRKGEIDYFGLPCAMHNLHRDFLVGLFFCCGHFVFVYGYRNMAVCVCVHAYVCGCAHECVLVCVHEENYFQHTDVKGPHTTIGVSILLWISFALHQF